MQHCFVYASNAVLAQHSLSRAETRHPRLDESFSIYILRMQYDVWLYMVCVIVVLIGDLSFVAFAFLRDSCQETNDSNQNDILSYISWQKYQDDARREVFFRASIYVSSS